MDENHCLHQRPGISKEDKDELAHPNRFGEPLVQAAQRGWWMPLGDMQGRAGACSEHLIEL